MNQGFEIETMFNDGQRVKILKNGKNTTVISSDWVDVTTVLDYVNSFDWAYYTPMGIFFGDELQAVESFDDIQMSWIRNVGNVPQSVTYPYDEFELAYRHLVKLHDLVSDYKCNYDLITIKRDRNAKR